jgi:hypothetical protein
VLRKVRTVVDEYRRRVFLAELAQEEYVGLRADFDRFAVGMMSTPMMRAAEKYHCHKRNEWPPATPTSMTLMSSSRNGWNTLS